MSWWKRALYDTCSIITLDKLLLERAGLARFFPTSIVALEESFTADQLRAVTAKRMRHRVTISPLPPPADLANLLSSPSLSKALSTVDTLIYATAVHAQFGVVTADRRLAKVIQEAGLQVTNMAIILRVLVTTKKLSQTGCEKLLAGLASRNDLLLGVPRPTWADLKHYSFPD